jgi:hypothetical protein
VDGTNVYLATGDGIAVVDVSEPTTPSLLARRTGLMNEVERGPLRLIWDVAVDGDRLVAVGSANENYSVNGAVLLDVSDPDAPTVLDELQTPSPIHNAAFEDRTVYLTANDQRNHPMVVLSTEGDELTEVGRWTLLDRNEDWRAVKPFLRFLHDIVVRNGIAYLMYWDAGTWIVDVSDPANPNDLGRLPAYEPSDLEETTVSPEYLLLPGNHHSGALSEDGTLFALGREAWTVEQDGTVTGSPGGIELWDVGDPTAPEAVSTIDAPPSPDNTRSGGQFTTAHNFDIVDGRLYSSWYFGGVKVHDVSEPSAPRELYRWKHADDASFWTAQAAPDQPFFVGSSADEGNATAGLYTFPEPDGDETTDRSGQSGVRGESEGSGDSGQSGSGNESGRSDTPLPGFGLAATATALGLGAWRLRRETPDE